MHNIDDRYIAVIYNMIMHTAQKLQRQNLGQTLFSRTTPHSSPVFLYYSKENYRDI